jgi:hypothetical protein
MKQNLKLDRLKMSTVKALSGIGLAGLLGLALANSSLGAEPKSWGTFGGSPKLEVPNLARVDLSVEVPPQPENYKWTVVPRKNSNSGTSAIGHMENISSGFLTPKEVAFGTVIVPLRIKGYKNNMHYQFESAGKELIWLDGVFLKIEAK